MTRSATNVAATALCLVTSCTGTIGGLGSAPGETSNPPGDPGGAPTVDPIGLPGPGLAAANRPRRLSVDEYNRTVLSLLGDTANAAQVLIDARKPFDNDVDTQVVSSTLITSAELLAGDAATRLLSDKARRDRIVGCIPPAGDVMGTACLRQFITRFGRRAWRRPLSSAEVDILMGFQSVAVQDKDFYSAVDGVVRAVLQDPEFLFRIEAGTPVPGSPDIFKLTGPEMATRLSYFLWGDAPDDKLLTLGEGGGLDTTDGVRKAATDMLARPAALARIARFHALWMGYERLPTSPLAVAMMDETDHLMSRVIFEKKLAWQDLLRSQETYATYDLARHYGISIPSTLAALKPGSTAAAWIPYAGSKRQGLFSHATFLQLGVKNGDTHPVLRGKGIRELLFCQELAKPANMKTDLPPKSDSPCKRDELAAHAASACASCHKVMDPVGFGLESYDFQGKYRAYEYRKKNPDPKLFSLPAQAGSAGSQRCEVTGDGDLDGKIFNGPAGLADLMLASPDLNACAVKQLYRFVMGRTEIDEIDRQFLEVMGKRIGASDFRFHDLVLDFVSSGAFAHRRQVD